MSIESILTLGVAAAILLGAALLRLIVLGSLRLLFALTGRQVFWAPGEEKKPPTDRPRPRIRRPAWRAARSFGAGLIYVFATLGTWFRAGGAGLGDRAGSSYQQLAPRLRPNWSELRRRLAATGAKIASVTVVAIASVQHLSRLVGARVKERVDRRSARRARQEDALDDRVIVLDRGWDPLTDPLEDEPASQAR